MKVLLVLPAYNEEETIVRTVKQIRDQEFPTGLEVD